MPEETCRATTELPDGKIATCNAHRPGWHLHRYMATWPEQLEPEDQYCSTWVRKDTASGLVWVCCGMVPHDGNLHHAYLGGMPVRFMTPE